MILCEFATNLFEGANEDIISIFETRTSQKILRGLLSINTTKTSWILETDLEFTFSYTNLYEANGTLIAA